MMSRVFAAFFLLAVAPAWAQSPGGRSQTTLRVDVVYSHGGRVSTQFRVQLMGGINNIPVAVTMTDTSGTAEFDDVSPGEYRVVVSGSNIENADSGSFTIEDGRAFQSQLVAVRPKVNPSDAPIVDASVSAVDLNAPKDAVKEYDRGNREMAQENWTKAIEHFNKAVAIYPQYSSAYNNLGACYGRLAQKDRQLGALQKAISLNERCVPAMVNLAELSVEENKLSDAGVLLSRATAADPTNLDALALLARLDFMEGQYDLVVATVRKAHSLPHEHYAIIHYTAASALEREGRTQDAIAELQVFLQEEPQGPRADTVRKAMIALQASAH